MKAKLLAKLDKLELLGNELRFPDTRPIQDGLFELRVGKKTLLAHSLLLQSAEKFIFFASL